MTAAWVLLTAMPPTVGHLALVDFARHAAAEVTVVVCTQPDEPYVLERVTAVREAMQRRHAVRVVHLHATMPQRPEESPDFWPMWRELLRGLGFADGNLVVASEPYGAPLAEAAGGEFVPFDVARDIIDSRATRVRENPLLAFDSIIPEFQPVLRRTITVFGAESVGKTTLSRDLAERLGAHWLPEWARPYLEALPDPRVDEDSMHAIHRGQRALQAFGAELRGRPFVVQDTDLVSTLGYWEHWTPSTVPPELESDAVALASDLYLVLASTIPFVPDPLRYGGHERETPDAYWTQLLERLSLPYAVIEHPEPETRLAEAVDLARAVFLDNATLAYARR